MHLSNVMLCTRLYTKKSVPSGVLIILNNSCWVVFLNVLHCIAGYVNKPKYATEKKSM